MKKLGHEFVYGGHPASLSAAAIVWSLIIISGQLGGFSIVLMAYFASQIVYNYDHLKEGIKGNYERTIYLMKTKKLQTFLFMFYIFGFIITAFYTAFLATLWFVFIIFGGVLYTSWFKRFTKHLIGFKNFYVSFFWSSLVIPVMFHYSLFSLFSLFVVFFIFIFERGLMNTIFFDIKDVKSDRLAKLRTFPVELGVEKTLRLLHFINISSFATLVFGVLLGLLPVFSLSLVLFYFYGLYYLSAVGNVSTAGLKKFSYFIVDGECLLWPLVLMIGKLLV